MDPYTAKLLVDDRQARLRAEAATNRLARLARTARPRQRAAPARWLARLLPQPTGTREGRRTDLSVRSKQTSRPRRQAVATIAQTQPSETSS